MALYTSRLVDSTSAGPSWSHSHGITNPLDLPARGGATTNGCTSTSAASIRAGALPVHPRYGRPDVGARTHRRRRSSGLAQVRGRTQPRSIARRRKPACSRPNGDPAPQRRTRRTTLHIAPANTAASSTAAAMNATLPGSSPRIAAGYAPAGSPHAPLPMSRHVAERATARDRPAGALALNNSAVCVHTHITAPLHNPPSTTSSASRRLRPRVWRARWVLIVDLQLSRGTNPASTADDPNPPLAASKFAKTSIQPAREREQGQRNSLAARP